MRVCKRTEERKRKKETESGRERDSDRITKSYRYEGLERGNTVQEHTQ